MKFSTNFLRDESDLNLITGDNNETNDTDLNVSDQSDENEENIGEFDDKPGRSRKSVPLIEIDDNLLYDSDEAEVMDSTDTEYTPEQVSDKKNEKTLTK